METPRRAGDRVIRTDVRRGPHNAEATVTEGEKKSMLRAALLLAGAALVRFLVFAPAPAEAPLADRPSIADSLLAAGDSAVETKARRSRPLAAGETIDPNVASEEELDRLPGVGASIAMRIVQDREQNGPFTRPEDLARVPGLGARSVERLRPHLRVAFSGSRPQVGRAGPEASRRAAGSTGGGTPGSASGARSIDLNRATAAELQTLPGIGPVTAERIIAFRNENGRFADVSELVKVRGVGPSTLARVAPLVTVR